MSANKMSSHCSRTIPLRMKAGLIMRVKVTGTNTYGKDYFSSRDIKSRFLRIISTVAFFRKMSILNAGSNNIKCSAEYIRISPIPD